MTLASKLDSGSIVAIVIDAIYDIWLIICVLHFFGCIDAPLVEKLMCCPYCCCYTCCGCRDRYEARRKIKEGRLGGSGGGGGGARNGEAYTVSTTAYSAAYPQPSAYAPQYGAPGGGYGAQQQQQPPPGYGQQSGGRSLTGKWDPSMRSGQGY